MNLSHQSSPPQSYLETLCRPTPPTMTPQELSFHRQSYSSAQRAMPLTHQMYPALVSRIPSRSALHMYPQAAVLVPSSLPCGPVAPDGSNAPRYTPHPFQVLPTSMMVRKPEPISWIKYPVEPHHIYPGPYAAVDLPFEDLNNNASDVDVPKSYKKGKLSSTWGPQKLKCLEKSRKCVRFASTWGPAHPARGGEYATINPRKLTSRYVRPAVFRRSNLKE